MKRYIIFLSISIIGVTFLSFSSSNKRLSITEEIVTETEKPEKLFEDLFLPKSGGVFRGVNFNDSRETIETIEKSRSIVTVLDDQKEGEITFTTDMGIETLNFADITYLIDEKGMFGIDVETFIQDKEMANGVYDLSIKYLTKKFGAGEIAIDGYTEFKDSKNNILFAIKDISEADDYGMKIHIDILTK